MDDKLLTVEKIIKSVLRSYRSRLQEVGFEYSDMVSEGWIVFYDCLAGYDESVGAKFTTYFYQALKNKYIIILQSAWKHKSEVDSDGFEFEANCPLQDSCVMVKEAIEAISEVSKDFAFMITEGVQQDLLSKARRRMRAKKFKRNNNFENVDGGRLLFTKDLLESHFSINLSELKELSQKFI